MSEIMKHEGGAVAPQSVLEYAIAKGVDVETLERLIALQRQVTDNDARMDFHAAMNAFKAECPPAPKVSKGAVRNDGSRKVTQMFAGLDVIAEHIRPYLARHGLSYRFETEIDAAMTRMICVVAHVHGHEERSAFACQTSDASVPGASKVQIGGSAMSYGMRYSLIAALGLTSADVDDDGAGTFAAPAPTIHPGRAADLQSLAEEVSQDLGKMFAHYGVEGFAEMTEAQAKEAQRIMERKRGAS